MGYCRSEDHPVVLARDIPFNKLVLSQSNVRRIKAGVSNEDLAASIVRRGLIQSLSVFPVVDAEGVETDMSFQGEAPAHIIDGARIGSGLSR